MHNAMIAWGLASLAGSFAWRYLADSRDTLYDGHLVENVWRPAELILGVVFLLVAFVLALKAGTGWH